jgi:hypothetical protein
MYSRNKIIRTIGFASALIFVAFSPTARAVDPQPEAGYRNFNTAEGENALFSLTIAVATPEAPPRVRYMVVELGGRRANDISESGQIVGNEELPSGIRHAAFWRSSRSPLISAHCRTSAASARALIRGARWWDMRLTATCRLSCPYFGQALTVHPSSFPVCPKVF